jgi:hypothetical protein
MTRKGAERTLQREEYAVTAWAELYLASTNYKDQ